MSGGAGGCGGGRAGLQTNGVARFAKSGRRRNTWDLEGPRGVVPRLGRLGRLRDSCVAVVRAPPGKWAVFAFLCGDGLEGWRHLHGDESEAHLRLGT